MNWNFFKAKEKAIVEDQVQNLREDVAGLDEKVESTNEQIKKLARLQFKMVKNMEDGFEEMKSGFQTQNEQVDFKSQIDEFLTNQNQLVQHFIRLLDEMDHISAGLNDGQEAWLRLLEEWSRTTVRTLNDVGIHELDVLGKGFDPTLSEALGTVDKDPQDPTSPVPYQVMRVLKRGFGDNKGNLIRKAQVVTLKEHI